uniref:Uncharacterized protein n=1 Tax=Panagrolaimus davidi TaxID=227884 RepID=A0A914PSC9_9BILA
MASDRNIIVKIERIMGCYTTFTPINIETRKGEPKIVEALFDAEKLWKELCKKVKINKVKGIAFILNDRENKSWQDAYAFRQKCYEYCQENGIYYFYSSTLAFQISVGISKTKVPVEEGEEILVIYVEGVALHGQSFIREKSYFRAINSHLANDPNFTKKFKDVYLKGCKPKKIILMRFGNGKFIEQVIKFFKDDDTIVVDVDAEAVNDSLVQKMLRLMDGKISSFDVPAQLQTVFVVKLDKEILMAVGYENALPFEKSVIIDCSSGKAVSVRFFSILKE